MNIFIGKCSLEAYTPGNGERKQGWQALKGNPSFFLPKKVFFLGFSDVSKFKFWIFHWLMDDIRKMSPQEHLKIADFQIYGGYTVFNQLLHKINVLHMIFSDQNGLFHPENWRL